jgi:hypothetical protein
MDLASSALASNRGIARPVQWEMVIRAAYISLSVEQVVEHERSWTSLLQVHSGFNFGYCKHSTPGIVMMSNKGGREVKLGNRGITMSHPSSVWSGITPQSRVVVSSASCGYRTEHPRGSRSFGPNPFRSFPLQPILFPYFSPLLALLLTNSNCGNVKAAPTHKMEFQASEQGKVYELDISESENQQRMFIRLCALNSTVSYALDTLAQHRTLIEQLQDEVEALRSQNEDIQRRLE